MKTYFRNGNIYSIDLKGSLTLSTAMIIEDDKIQFVGTDTDAEGYIDTETTVVDLEGKMVIPGLSDGHVHAAWTAMDKFCVNLYQVRGTSKDEVINRIREVMIDELKNNPATPILRGAGYDSGIFVTQGYPTAKDLDEISEDIPIVLRSFCYHYAWANSKALELSGINQNTLDPRNGKIFRDEKGFPTGYFSEMSAINLLIDQLKGCDFSVEEYKEAILDYQYRLANQYGVTMIFDALATQNAMIAYKELAEENRLTIRINANYYADPTKGLEQFDKICSIKPGYGVSDVFHINTVKFFMDGSGTEFYMGEPFEQGFLAANSLPEDYRGFPIWSQEEIDIAFEKINKAGFQIHVHAMGDAAVSQTIDAFEKVNELWDVKSNRNVIAHMMCIKEEDKARMGKLGIIACMQPCWGYVEGFYEYYYVPLFGEERSQKMYPLKTFIENNTRLTFGTDYPVTPPPNPYFEIEYSMTRSIMTISPDYDRYKGMRMGPKESPSRECLSLKEAIEALTISGAYEHFIEDITGSLEAGKSADFVVLDRNLEQTPIAEIGKTMPIMTYFKGAKVFQAE